MIYFLVTTLVTALSLLVTDILLPGVNLSTFVAAVVAAIAIGAVNGSLRPVLALLTLPINILTLGVFSLIINGFCFWLASLLVPGFSVHGFFAFILGPVILSIASSLLGNYVTESRINRLIPGSSSESLEAGK